jgi:hypothetical protein
MLYHLITQELLGLILIKIYTEAPCSSFLPLLHFYKAPYKNENLKVILEWMLQSLHYAYIS